MPSKKDHTSTRTPLINFLYRNSELLDSVFAQTNQGLVVNHKKVDTHETSSKHNISGSVRILSMLGEQSSKTNSHSELTFTPHDYKNLQVLAYLADNGYIKTHLNDCELNDIILVKGNLAFYGSGLLKIFLQEAIKMYTEQMPVKNKEERALKTLYSKAGNLFNEFKFNSIFVMESDGEYFMGAVKDAEMAEEISTFNFMLGPATLQNTTLLGVLNLAGQSLNLPAEHVLGAYQSVLRGLMLMLALPDANFVSPITIYQEL